MNEKTYSIIGDFHTHTMVSQHAYSTMQELIDASRCQGLQAIAITDHGPEMMDGAIAHHFICMNALPNMVDGIRLYKGAEVNIKDFFGRIDLPEHILKNLDFTIASFHVEAITPGTVEENTAAWLAVVRNTYVDCLGHAGNPMFPFHHEEVIKEVRSKGRPLRSMRTLFLYAKAAR